MSAAFSVRDMLAGDTKYIIGLFINGALRGYLSRGFASLPNRNWWGTSGTIIYPLQANDEVRFRYVVNNNGNALDAVFVNIWTHPTIRKYRYCLKLSLLFFLPCRWKQDII